MPRPTRPAIAVACLALLLLPLCFLGFGSDNDTYTVLDAGRATWLAHIPQTSRNPGYWAFEALVFVLARAGGFLATNLTSLAVASILLWRFIVMARKLAAQHPVLLAATLAATPVFAIAATSTDDYLWSLLGLVLCIEALLADRPLLAILPAAFAFAIRGANGPLLAAAYLIAIYQHRSRPGGAAKFLASAVAAAALGGVPYAVSYSLAGHSLAFLHAQAGPASMWTLVMRLGRFALKSCYLFGPLASAVLFFAWRRSKPQPTTALFVAIVAANLGLFLLYPIEISYLLPAAFFALLLLARRLQSRPLTCALLAATLTFNLISPQLVAPDTPGRATAAHFHPAVLPGPLVEDIRLRLALRGCADYRCYYLHFHPGSHDLDPVLPK
jgi:hypothetical protein